MSDETETASVAAPAPAVPTPAPDWLQPNNEHLARMNEQRAISRLLAGHDAARAAAGRSTLVAVADFTIVDDENPDGRVVKMGEEFEVSDFDLPRFLGKGLFKLEDPRRNTAHG